MKKYIYEVIPPVKTFPLRKRNNRKEYTIYEKYNEVAGRDTISPCCYALLQKMRC